MQPSANTLQSRLEALQRSELWFADGNIVLVAGSSTFKVHRGQLERHSEVFNDLFSIPQPSNQELLDGSPWVELHDNPFDVFYFLKALYDGLYFHQPHAEDFSAIAAVLRLSTKYLVEHLRQLCLIRLELDWPSTLAGWDRREKEATDGLGRYSPRDLFVHPILALEVAQELDLSCVMSAAYYDLSRYGPSKIFIGTPRPAQPSIHSDATGQEEPSTNARLSREYLYRTLRGREHAQMYVAGFIEKELKARPISDDCTNKADDRGRFCRESFYFIMLNILRSVGGIASGRDGDPLYTLAQAGEMMSRTDFSDGQRQCGLRICEACKADFAECVESARDEVWKLIPGWFGLEPRREDLGARAK